MKRVNPGMVAVAATVGLMTLVTIGVAVKSYLGYRGRQARLSQPVAVEEPETFIPDRAPPPLPEPVDPEQLAVALARFGPLSAWAAGAEPCPEPLPSMHTQVRRMAPDAFGVRQVVVPPPPIPIRIARDPERALVALNEPVSEPTLVILQNEWVLPTLDNRRLFTGGRAAGRAFLRVPGNDTIACAGDYTASNSPSVQADPSELELSQLENRLALDADLVVQENAAAVAALRQAEQLED